LLRNKCPQRTAGVFTHVAMPLHNKTKLAMLCI
jgi:hypothetical protein